VSRPNELVPAFCDFETFWDVKYTLKSMSTTDYVHDDRFAIHGASCAIADHEPMWLTGDDLWAWIKNSWCAGHLFVGHHTLFDGYIIRHRYKVSFEHYFCTMGMIEALFQGAVGRGLDEAMTTLLGWESGKTDILTRTKGKYWDQFTPDEQYDMGFYANQDLKATQELFYKFGPSLPHSEWLTMSNMLKMFCRPLLEFDEKILKRALVTAINEREEEIETAIKIFDCTEDDLRGVNSFEELLARCEYPMPMKPSPSKKDKMIPALAKTDQGFQDMLESDDPRVKALAEARRAVKSTQGGDLQVPTRSMLLTLSADRISGSLSWLRKVMSLPSRTPARSNVDLTDILLARRTSWIFSGRNVTPITTWHPRYSAKRLTEKEIRSIFSRDSLERQRYSASATRWAGRSSSSPSKRTRKFSLVSTTKSTSTKRTES
jgi:hypothetical protein